MSVRTPSVAHARVAVYDAPAAAPYVEEVFGDDARAFVETLSVRVFELARDRGGAIPYTVVREITENLIHAGFAEPVVSVLDEGRVIRFSDQGPGIADKVRVMQPGFTTATREMKDVIRGVGSGLPIVNDFLSLGGGSLEIQDNLSRGTVVTISSAPAGGGGSLAVAPRPSAPPLSVDVHAEGGGLFSPRGHEPSSVPSDRLRLTTRQKQVLALVLESGSAGPSLVSRELGVGLSTAYRDLASLEDFGLISSESGKRVLTEEGLVYLGSVSSSQQPI